jgi:hypothetical protein
LLHQIYGFKLAFLNLVRNIGNFWPSSHFL